jgi:hypothetical protein
MYGHSSPQPTVTTKAVGELAGVVFAAADRLAEDEHAPRLLDGGLAGYRDSHARGAPPLSRHST